MREDLFQEALVQQPWHGPQVHTKLKIQLPISKLILHSSHLISGKSVSDRFDTTVSKLGSICLLVSREICHVCYSTKAYADCQMGTETNTRPDAFETWELLLVQRTLSFPPPFRFAHACSVRIVPPPESNRGVIHLRVHSFVTKLVKNVAQIQPYGFESKVIEVFLITSDHCDGADVHLPLGRCKP